MHPDPRDPLNSPLLGLKRTCRPIWGSGGSLASNVYDDVKVTESSVVKQLNLPTRVATHVTTPFLVP